MKVLHHLCWDKKDSVAVHIRLLLPVPQPKHHKVHHLQSVPDIGKMDLVILQNFPCSKQVFRTHKHAATSKGFVSDALFSKEREGLITLQPMNELSNVATEHNYQTQWSVIRCWHPLSKLWHNCTPWRQIWAMKSTNLISHIEFLPWRQLDGCNVTRPFLSAKGVACETNELWLS